MSETERVVRRAAVRVVQDRGREIYLFSLPAETLARITDVRRAKRDADGSLAGYQRSVVTGHVKNIVDYLDGNNVLLPNSIVLALSRRARFLVTKAAKKAGDDSVGTIEIPIGALGSPKSAWIVDGQQRATALASSSRKQLPVPVNAFFADEEVQREQFLRVNSIRSVSQRLVDELLPAINGPLPARLQARRLPSILCDQLNSRRQSPFRGLVRRATFVKGLSGTGVISDGPMMRMLHNSIGNGALSRLWRPDNANGSVESMLRVVHVFWSAAKTTFPDAWGLPPNQSRLMHGAGIVAMGRLMDRIMNDVDAKDSHAVDAVSRSLRKIAPSCAWVSGKWPKLGLAWNEVQSVPSHVRGLSDFLVSLHERPRI